MRRAARAALTGLAVLLAAAPPAAPEDVHVGCADGRPGQPIVRVCYEMPTRRYGHGALGTRGEWERLGILVKAFIGNTGQGITRQVRLEQPAMGIFEDLAPRLADLDGDGIDEIVVVESTFEGGAQLVVYGVLPGGEIVRAAETAPIGRFHRWLAPVGIADFDGDGEVDIAYVETPHIGGVLRFITLKDGKLAEIASREGFSNHRFGETVILGGVRDCGSGPEVFLPDQDGTTLHAVRFAAGILVAEPIGPMAGADSLAAAAACADRS